MIRSVEKPVSGRRDTVARLEELEAAARALQPAPEARATQTRAAIAYVEEYFRSLGEKPVYMPDRRDGGAGALAVAEEPVPIDDALATLADQVDSTGQNLVSPRFFGYIPSGAVYAGALGDFIAAAINRYAGVHFSAPGAAELEQELIRWLAREVGYPDSVEGDLTSGGSLAAVSAVAAARQAAGIRAKDVERLVIYSTDLTHHTFIKALRLTGLHECRQRSIPLDDRYRMDAGALERSIRGDREAGLRPWFIAATGGTTDLGTIDPLPALADIAAANEMWLHVDGAYGGSFALCAEGKRRLAGIERSDSMILNPHKGLFLPCGLGVVLVRDGSALYDAYHGRGAYMQDLESGSLDARSACDFSPELTRPFRGLRLWLPLKLAGVSAFRAALEEKLLLAEYFHERIREMPGFETGPPPDLSVVAFRYRPERGDADRFNRELADAIRDDGRIFLSTTTLDGRYTLRMAILGYHTHLDDVELALEVIGEVAAKLSSS